MGTNPPHQPSHLFLVRLWLDPGEGEGSDSLGHGKVQHVLTGESGAFTDWSSLIDRLASLATRSRPPAPSAIPTVIETGILQASPSAPVGEAISGEISTTGERDR